jgi:hypothetical protein
LFALLMMGGSTTRKHVEHFPDKINCVTLHLVGYILECVIFLKDRNVQEGYEATSYPRRTEMSAVPQRKPPISYILFTSNSTNKLLIIPDLRYETTPANGTCHVASCNYVVVKGEMGSDLKWPPDCWNRRGIKRLIRRSALRGKVQTRDI